MPNLRNKNWTSETPAFKEDAQFWEDHLYDGKADQNIAKEVERATAAENKLESEKADKTTATSSADGLMSKSDKAKLDGIGAGSNVKSVNGKTGAVTLSKADVGLGNVDNTKDADKPISTAVQTALDAKANNSVATESTDGLMSAADKAKLDGIDPSAITTNAANIKKNADEIAKLNSATAEYRLMINHETGHMALAHYTKEA